MARSLVYRDFTLFRAALLAALIGLAVLAGGVPHEGEDRAGAAVPEARRMPAVLDGGEKAPCDDWAVPAI